MSNAVEVGDRVFFSHPEDSWLIGTVRDVSAKYKTCVDDNGREFQAQEVHKVIQSSLDPVHDLLKMSYLHDSTLLHHVRERYWKNTIYTNIGPIILALNPYNYNLPMYNDKNMPNYIKEGMTVLSHGSKQVPHSWSIAHQAYCLMRMKQQNQSILVSGESGAGKTEAVKIVMKYVGELSTQAATAEEKQVARQTNAKVTSTSPILETFGNAKTTRNDNSSRFGKFMKMKFNDHGMLVGAHITPYLLERSRVIQHGLGERGYHAFYQLVAGASPEDKRRMQLGEVGDYRALNAGGAPSIAGVDDAEEYNLTREAMTVVGITKQEQDSIYNILAAILHLTNCAFKERDGKSFLSDADSRTVSFVCRDLLKIDAAVLLEDLTSTTKTVAGDTYTTSLDKDHATEQRDSLCKALYEHVFLWLVNRINGLIDVERSETNWIGLLDIFGFEHFEKNSFEQLCINLTNEQLQQHYNNYIFTRDLNECRDEGIDTQSIVFKDNQGTLDLITSALGVLSLLDEEVQLRKGSDHSFISKLAEAQGSHGSYVKHRLDRDTFGIRHYAGTVMYTVDGWREKNMDTLKNTIKQLVRTSTDNFIKNVLPAPVEIVGRKPTVARIYKNQLQELMGVVNATNPHWIRCIKPHNCKQPRNFHGQEVMNQLRSAGVLETVRIRKMGFSVRLSFADFVARYRCITTVKGRPRDVCAGVLKALGLGPQMGQVGKTKVFLKNESWSVVEDARARCLNVHCVVLQRFAMARTARVAAAVRVANEKVKLAQAFARYKTSSRYVRQTEYYLKEEELLEGAARLQACVKEEDRNRIAMMKLEFDQMQALGEMRRRGAQNILEKWYMDKPIRDALAISDFKVDEEGARFAMERFEQEELLNVLDVLKEDFQVMQHRQLQRERLEDEQRFRLEEAARQEQKQKARVLWSRAMEQKRMQEAILVEEEHRKKAQLQKVSNTMNEARHLYQTEREQVQRMRRDYDELQFCSSVPKHRVNSPTRGRSPASRRMSNHHDHGGFGAPTFSRVSMAGSAQASQLYSSTPPPTKATRTKSVSRAKSPMPPRIVKAEPTASHSLDMVKRLQKLSKAVQANPYRLITHRFSPLHTKSPLNPNNPDWAPGQDGTILLPDGSRCTVDELAQREAY
ncbi:Myosin-2 [Diplonema papillatum]|nr:Myosin-2 [Diplonema papillatum]